MSLICILPVLLNGLKSRMLKLRQDIQNDPIIKDQMAGLSSLFVCTFGNYLMPVLTAAHTANNADFSDGRDHENEDYESERP